VTDEPADSAPPDGLIAKRFAADADLGEAGTKFMYLCLLRGMRGERMPAPGGTAGVTPEEGGDIRQAARALLPQIERIRLGEEALIAKGPPPEEETQEALPF